MRNEIVAGLGPFVSASQLPTQASTTWMFDVDGVLVSLISKCTEEKLVDILVQRLSRGDTVTFNSGRSPIAIVKLILSLLEQRITDKSLLLHTMVVGEKGGAWATYTSQGTLQIMFDTTLTLPYILQSVISSLVLDPEFVNILEIEEGKKTMMSVIKRRNISMETFQHAQYAFVPLVQRGLEGINLHTTWKVDPVSDAIEIEHVSAGKDKGAHRIMHWLQTQNLFPQQVIAFEDSPSGITMAEALHQLQVPVTFVFTGTKNLPKSFYPFPVIYTTQKYELGTHEYLKHYQNEEKKLSWQ